MESTFQLRIVSDDTDAELRKTHTKQVWDKKQRRTVDKLNEGAYIVALLDYAIVGWSGIKDARTGDDVACTAALKARLPEKVKAEILRLCAAKEAGDVVSKAEQEKKVSASISTSK
jgi:hypothetical protein